MSDEEYGPALPPELLRQKSKDQKFTSSEKGQDPCSDDDNDSYIGPILPPSLKQKKMESDQTQPEKDYIGPVLPPGFGQHKAEEKKNTVDNNMIGPVLPPHLRSVSGSKTMSRSAAIGPALPPGFMKHNRDESDESSADEETIGPLPTEMDKGDSTGYEAYQFEERARKMKDRLEGKDNKEEKLVRESWMTELPSTKLGQSIGLSARTFRANAGPDLTDRSVWTDTPEEKEKKFKDAALGTGKGSKRDREDYQPSKRDKKLRKQIEEYNQSKRPESLMEMHEKKLKKEKEKEVATPKERRPFDRDIDLQANRFDDAQKKSIIKKSQKLNSRFGHGSTEFL
ncbi:GPALPP motifs-containing protein 1-like [Ylistrum balloti]|uniref:GPALPP motifs-containing protein 1-like n=1 Tax=Ylistrum balloti TaxID=509963 RepID=UPI002905E320|nr:GPALPP motifs-containing protein 1-like [Ylistrum balloti]